MNKIIDFYWFSGTGNTLQVARAMGQEFTAAGRDVRLIRLETADPRAVDPAHTLGIACAVATQSTYPLVWRFLRALPPAPGTAAFLVDTLAMYSGGIVGPLRRLLERKGYRPLGAREIRMPSNFLCRMRNPKTDRTRQATGLAEARAYARALIAGQARWPQSWFWQDVLCYCSTRPWVWRWMRRLLPVRVDAAKCVHCGLCVKLCPVKNITMTPDQPPRFADRCELCQRCLAFCPRRALTLGGTLYAAYQAATVGELICRA